MNGRRIGWSVAFLAAVACLSAGWGAGSASAAPQDEPVVASYRTMPPSDPKPDDPKKPKRVGIGELSREGRF